MNVDQIRRAQDRLDQAQEELLRWESRLSELEEEAPERGLLRERRTVEAGLRAAEGTVRDAKRALLHLRMLRPRRSDGRHAA